MSLLHPDEIRLNILALRRNTLTTYDLLLDLFDSKTYSDSFYDISLYLKS